MGKPVGIWSLYSEDGSEITTLNLSKKEVCMNGVVINEGSPNNYLNAINETESERLTYYPECDEFIINTIGGLLHTKYDHNWGIESGIYPFATSNV